LKDPTLIGTAKDRRRDIMGSEDKFRQWQFQLLVQAYIASKGFGPVKDLKTARQAKGLRKCDFLVRLGSHNPELIECKRYHPAIEEDATHDKAFSKLTSRLSHVAGQLECSSKVFTDGDSCRHFIADISAYGLQEEVHEHGAFSSRIFGLTNEDLESLSDRLADEIRTHNHPIDKVTLCSRSTIVVEGHPCAINLHTKTVNLTDSAGFFDFDGWCVEAYPMKQAKLRELRIITRSQSLARIATTFHNLFSPESFYKITPGRSI
jgi:hypothetical protein